jgi:hypothetical protein
MPDSSKRNRKRRFWEVDANLCAPSGKFGLWERSLELGRAVGRYVLWGLILTYPLTMPLIGILFGGLAFWAAFGGSGLAIVILLRRFGLSRNFDSREGSLARGILGICGGFLCTLGFYYSLIFLHGWALPIAFGLLGLAFSITLRK